MEQQRKTNAFVGSPVERIEDLRFLKGRGQYVDDLTRAGLLHAVILRSQVAHGRIRAIDAAAARTRPGVVAVITAADIGAAMPTIPLRQEPLPALRQYEQPVIAHRKVRAGRHQVSTRPHTIPRHFPLEIEKAEAIGGKVSA